MPLLLESAPVHDHRKLTLKLFILCSQPEGMRDAIYSIHFADRMPSQLPILQATSNSSHIQRARQLCLPFRHHQQNSEVCGLVPSPET